MVPSLDTLPIFTRAKESAVSVLRRIGPAVAIAVLLPSLAMAQRERFPTTVPAETLAAPALSETVPVTPGSVPGPLPYGSGVQPPPANWDPYAPPGSMQSPALFPQGSYPASPTNPAYPSTPPVIPSFGGMTEKVQRFLDELRLDYVHVSPLGDKKFGTDDLDLSASFAFPFFSTGTSVFVTPGFTFHWWNGPTSTSSPPTGLFASLPPRVYDAYLDTRWNPQVTPWFGGELDFRIGVYSDFSKVTTESLRYTGRGLVVLTFNPAVKVKAGIFYLDRIRVKILPAGGIVWTPNSDVRFDILFPDPKIARRLTTMGNTEWWLYARGEYGGGSWTVTPHKAPGPMDQIDYNDIRIGVGLEFNRNAGIGGLIEIGTAFERELLLRSTHDKYTPSTTLYFRAGLVY